ncbi:flagellar biosynthetic protein FliR [Roseicitreum antarcticum]|uniref:Flagellar biosynthetic protein FliR n=1 Tax=Roseicitreum antarcticum TaxID=564137 RepID=A0A1H2UQW6_9RHOB|nr:flagellar biosynthetic protein FliR [Roseicitreum antarcticum]SDW58460.1 flagellar biosynthetic protein FliR [Roseicitreum antarcticum]
MTPELVTALNDLLGRATDLALAAAVVFFRVGAAMAFLPAFGEQVVPVRVRLGLALAYTALLTGALGPGAIPARGDISLPLALATETVIGLSLGFALRLFIIALQVAGTIAAQATSLSQLFGGAGVDPQPAMSQLMVVAGLALAVMAGLHVRLAEYLIHSYTLLPPGAFPDAGLLTSWGVAQVARSFGLAFSLALPFVIISVIFNLALGAINRAMPQLMVAFVGAPAITAGALVMLMITLPLTLPFWLTQFNQFLFNPSALP